MATAPDEFSVSPKREALGWSKCPIALIRLARARHLLPQRAAQRAGEGGAVRLKLTFNPPETECSWGRWSACRRNPRRPWRRGRVHAEARADERGVAAEGDAGRGEGASRHAHERGGERLRGVAEFVIPAEANFGDERAVSAHRDARGEAHAERRLQGVRSLPN